MLNILLVNNFLLYGAYKNYAFEVSQFDAFAYLFYYIKCSPFFMQHLQALAKNDIKEKLSICRLEFLTEHCLIMKICIYTYWNTNLISIFSDVK